MPNFGYATRAHYIWVANHGKVLRWQADGSPEWMIGELQDITLRKPAQRLVVNIAATQKEEKWGLTVQDNRLGVALKVL